MAFRTGSGVRFLVWLAIGLCPATLLAQETLPWNLSQYPDGGPLMTEAIATSLGGNAALTNRTCRVLSEATPEQAASGFAGIALAAFAAPQPTPTAIVEQFPDCCDQMLGRDADRIITLGAAVALEARAWGETEIDLGRQIEELVGLCSDDAFVRSYEIARGEDELGLLLAEGLDGDPGTTGTIQQESSGGGGLPSAN